MNVFGDRLRRVMEEKQIEGQDLAKILKVAQPTVSNWVNGKRSPNQEMLVSLADYFGVTVDYLLGRVDTERIKVVGLSGIESWSNSPFLDEFQKTVLKEHFAELTLRYKSVANRAGASALHFNDKLKRGEFAGGSEEFSAEWRSILGRDIDALKTWIDALPSQLGVAAAKSIGADPAYHKISPVEKIGDLEVSADEMKLIMRLIEESRKGNLNK